MDPFHINPLTCNIQCIWLSPRYNRPPHEIEIEAQIALSPSDPHLPPCVLHACWQYDATNNVRTLTISTIATSNYDHLDNNDHTWQHEQGARRHYPILVSHDNIVIPTHINEVAPLLRDQWIIHQQHTKDHYPQLLIDAIRIAINTQHPELSNSELFLQHHRLSTSHRKYNMERPKEFRVIHPHNQYMTEQDIYYPRHQPSEKRINGECSQHYYVRPIHEQQLYIPVLSPQLSQHTIIKEYHRTAALRAHITIKPMPPSSTIEIEP